ncbi:hypothetical protein WDW86_19005 [Bdellovibrionota bacterium FG-2]
MDRSREAQQILMAVRGHRFTLRDHAARRSDERVLSRQNVINIAQTVLDWKWQEDKQTHWFIGFFAEGQAGGFTAAMDNGVWIITVFKRKLTRREKELKK